ncbi:MAG TPA: 16S rRNA (cytosine(1402)-N(4))-methyltransferase RsmH [Kofleriaceae bacterium]|nr:16S rRNA (cytosine(1402)-N(4))-methyltransferase RsmH [Kofleriaceae bacterium]
MYETPSGSSSKCGKYAYIHLHTSCAWIARFLQSCVINVLATAAVASFAHAPVLAAEVLEALSPRDSGTYVDGTLGGAGHAGQLLARAPGARLVGIDRDPSALEASRAALAGHGDRVQLVHGTYGDIPAILAELGIERVDGILLDLGVSSPQLDVAERGFSFTRSGPLDMRMDPTTGRTALALIRDTRTGDLAELLFTLGEERHARKIARAIHDALAADRLATTTDLASAICSVIPAREQRTSKIHPATRTFQALRIAVNGELDQLERFLAAFPDLLAPGGRCAIISFHSLEDRLVKQRFRDLAWTTSLPAQLAERAGERVAAVCELVSRKAIVAGDAEVATNPRARSARLRVCQRTSAPNVPAQQAPRG